MQPKSVKVLSGMSEKQLEKHFATNYVHWQQIVKKKKYKKYKRAF